MKNDDSFSKQIDDVLSGKYNRFDALKVCDTPRIFLDAGLQQLPILYTQNHLKDALHEKSADNPHWHGLSIEQIKKVPKLLESPVLLMDSLNNDDSIVAVLSLLDNDNAPVFATIKPNGNGIYNSHKTDSNFMLSIYGKEKGFEYYIKRAAEENKILYWNKEKSQEIQCAELLMAQGLDSLDSNKILHQTNSLVNKTTSTLVIDSNQAARIKAAREIKENMPKLSENERAAAIAILEAGAKSQRMSISEYMEKTFPDGIFGDIKKAENSAKQQGIEINGAVSINGFGENAKAVIYASKTADFSTWCHELSHIWQSQLTGELKQNAEEAFQVKNSDWQNSIYTFEDGHADTSAEAFAYGFEDFLKHKAGEMATEDKKAIFEKFADYMSRTYNGVKQNIKINEKIAKVYEKFLQLDDNILAEAEKAVRLEIEQEQKINKIFNSPNFKTSQKVSETIGLVSDKFADLASRYGYDIKGYSHTIDNFFVSHALKQHGNKEAEEKRGNIAITHSDICNVFSVYTHPDYIIFGTKTKTGNHAIVYVKNIGDSTIFVEDVRSGKKELAAQTLYKKSGTIDVSSKKEAPELYAHSDPESVFIVDVKKEFVNEIENEFLQREKNIQHSEKRQDYIRKYYTNIKNQYYETEQISSDGKRKGIIEVSNDRNLNSKTTRTEIDALLAFTDMGAYATLLSESLKIGDEKHIDALLNHRTLVEIKSPTGNANSIAKEIKEAINKENSELVTVFLLDSAKNVSDDEILEKLEQKRKFIHGKTDGIFVIRNGILSEIKIPRVESFQTRSHSNSNNITDAKNVNISFQPVDSSMLFQSAYHGSSANFEKFNTSEYGMSGDGAMAFGYGVYVSNSETIARSYAGIQGERNLYSVEIPDGDYIVWDKKISNSQKEKVKNELYENLIKEDYKGVEKQISAELDNVFSEELDGKNLYGTVSSYIGSDKETSRFFKNIGYSGIQYPAGTPENAINYVIFDDNDITIKDHFQFQTLEKKETSELNHEKQPKIETSNQLQEKPMENQNIEPSKTEFSNYDSQEYLQNKLTTQMILDQEDREQMEAISATMKSATKDFMDLNATPITEIPFTKENYDKLFPFGIVQTPVEKVKLGEHQFEKLDTKDRGRFLLASYQTLATPDIVIEEVKEGKHSHNYIKSFVFDEKTKTIQDIVVNIDGENISISAHPRDVNNVLNKIKTPDQLVYAAAEVGRMIEQRVQNELEIVNPTRADRLSTISVPLNKEYSMENALSTINAMENSTNAAENSNPHYQETEERIDFLKTPTGNKSELSENEWKFSHSSEFKELYGDWEGKIKKDFLLSDDTVSQLTGNEFGRKEGFTLTEQVEQYFNEMNNSVESPFFGKVVLDKNGADDSLSHGMGRLKAVAYAGVPDVIKKGVIIDSDSNHKDRSYNSYVIAAPIKIADKNYICEVVLKQNKQENRFYLHEVTEQKKFLERAFVTNSAQKPAHQGTLSNILEKTVSVNYEISCPMSINGEPEKIFVQNEYRKSLNEFQSKNQNTAIKNSGSVKQEENPFKNADPEQIKELYEQAEAVEKMQQEAAYNTAVLDENSNPQYQTDEEFLQEYKQKYPESSLDISEDTKNELENVFSQIDDYLDKGIVPEERRFTLPKTPLYLKELGSNETAISIPVSVIKKAKETHGLSNDEIKNSLTRLFDPVAVFDTDKTKSENKLDSKLILTDEFSESKPIALALNINTQIQVQENGHRKFIEVQDIRSIHDRTLTAKNGTDLIKQWTENGLCRYVDDKKISEWSTVARVYFPIEALQSDKNNILTKSEVVNPQNSDSVKQEENPSLQMEPGLIKKFNEMKKAIESREKQESQTAAEKTESAGSRKAENHEKPKVDLIKKAAKDFISAIKNGTAPFLNSTEKDFGKISLRPAAIVNASNGLPFSGEAQLLAQIYYQQQKMEGEIVTTFEGAKESGTFIANKPESKKNFVLANKTEQQQKEIIQKTRYFMPEACDEPDKIYAHALQKQRPQKISDYRDLIRHFENIPNGQKEISDLRIRIAHEHLKEIQSRFAMKKERILTVDEINERKKILQDYFKNLPEKHRESEKNAFENTFGLTLNPEETFKTNLEGNFKNKKFEDVVKSNEKLTDQANRKLSSFIQKNSMEDKKLSEILHEEYNAQSKEEKETSKKLKIEAIGISEPETYLGKYLAACNANAEFVTDENTIKAVQSNLVKKLEENYRVEKYGILKEIGQQAQRISNETTSKIAFDKAHSNKNTKEKKIEKEIGPIGMGN